MRRARLTLAVVAAVGVASAMVAIGAAAAQKVFVESSINPGPVVMRPHEMLLSEDGTLALTAIKWESWGGPVATASGRGYVRGCTPDCAEGKVFRPRAKIRLSEVTLCEGKELYAKLQYAFTGRIPKGFKRRSTYDLRPYDKSGKPVC